MKAIISKWECPACGNLINKEEVLKESAGKFSFSGPGRCGCGRKAGFTLSTFEQGDAVVVDNKTGTILVPKNKEEKILALVQKELKEGKEK